MSPFETRYVVVFDEGMLSALVFLEEGWETLRACPIRSLVGSEMLLRVMIWETESWCFREIECKVSPDFTV